MLGELRKRFEARNDDLIRSLDGLFFRVVICRCLARSLDMQMAEYRDGLHRIGRIVWLGGDSAMTIHWLCSCGKRFWWADQAFLHRDGTSAHHVAPEVIDFGPATEESLLMPSQVDHLSRGARV